MPVPREYKAKVFRVETAENGEPTENGLVTLLFVKGGVSHPVEFQNPPFLNAMARANSNHKADFLQWLDTKVFCRCSPKDYKTAMFNFYDESDKLTNMFGTAKWYVKRVPVLRGSFNLDAFDANRDALLMCMRDYCEKLWGDGKLPHDYKRKGDGIDAVIMGDDDREMFYGDWPGVQAPPSGEEIDAAQDVGTTEDAPRVLSLIEDSTAVGFGSKSCSRSNGWGRRRLR